MCGDDDQAATCHETTPNRHRKAGQRHLVYARLGWLQSPFGKNAYRPLLRLQTAAKGMLAGTESEHHRFHRWRRNDQAMARDCLSMGFDQDFTIGIITLGSCLHLVKRCGVCAACSERGVIECLVNHQNIICYRGRSCGFKCIVFERRLCCILRILAVARSIGCGSSKGWCCSICSRSLGFEASK